MIYIQLFLYLQVLDLFTSLIGFKLGLGEASPFIRTLMRFGPVLGVALSKGIALLLAAFCLAKERHRLIRAINYWYAGLITWNLCAILASLPAR